MIVFGSQRGGGADLATHLANTHDNELVETMDLRGSIAEDAHGAFAEWEAQAHALTRAQKYLYSLSINPDQRQGRLTEEQYLDYVQRAEESLGLSDQPRFICKHVKADQHGNLREHYHVVWSRIDADNERAVPIAFDKTKLMDVTRAFARDHGLKLPAGYEKGRSLKSQLSLYEKAQFEQTGISREQHQELITDLWRTSDSAKAFVAGLESNGYLLARGRRPYVLVDIYGHTHALPRMVDDKSVRQKDVEARLSGEFPSDDLPSVEEAQSLAASHHVEQVGNQHKAKQDKERAGLKAEQEARAKSLEREREELLQAQQSEQARLAEMQTAEHNRLQRTHAAKQMETSFNRARKEPTGIAAFFAKFSGVTFMRSQLHRFEDRLQRSREELERKVRAVEQDEKRALQAAEQELERAGLVRREHAQKLIFVREQRSLEFGHQKERAIFQRRHCAHMPAFPALSKKVEERKQARAFLASLDAGQLKEDFTRATCLSRRLSDEAAGQQELFNVRKNDRGKGKGRS